MTAHLDPYLLSQHWLHLCSPDAESDPGPLPLEIASLLCVYEECRSVTIIRELREVFEVRDGYPADGDNASDGWSDNSDGCSISWPDLPEDLDRWMDGVAEASLDDAHHLILAYRTLDYPQILMDPRLPPTHALWHLAANVCHGSDLSWIWSAVYRSGDLARVQEMLKIDPELSPPTWLDTDWETFSATMRHHGLDPYANPPPGELVSAGCENMSPGMLAELERCTWTATHSLGEIVEHPQSIPLLAALVEMGRVQVIDLGEPRAVSPCLREQLVEHGWGGGTHSSLAELADVWSILETSDSDGRGLLIAQIRHYLPRVLVEWFHRRYLQGQEELWPSCCDEEGSYHYYLPHLWLYGEVWEGDGLMLVHTPSSQIQEVTSQMDTSDGRQAYDDYHEARYDSYRHPQPGLWWSDSSNTLPMDWIDYGACVWRYLPYRKMARTISRPKSARSTPS